jgi:hypothetical protein
MTSKAIRQRAIFFVFFALRSIFRINLLSHMVKYSQDHANGGEGSHSYSE